MINEYILISGVNDQPKHARSLVQLIGRGNPDLVHINLIPYNPVVGTAFKRSSSKSVHTFAKILSNHGIQNTFRVIMGDDIKAACGQLATT